MRVPKCKLFGYGPGGEPVHVQHWPHGVEARHYARDCRPTDDAKGGK
jgi:hypothetical protein